TVIVGNAAGDGGVAAGAGVSWARAMAAVNAIPANAARLATRMNDMKGLLDQQAKATRQDASRFQLLGEERWAARVAWAVADADGRELPGRQQGARDRGDALDEHEGRRRLDEARGMGEAEAAFMLLGRQGAGTRIAVGIGRGRIAEGGPQGRRRAVAQQRG